MQRTRMRCQIFYKKELRLFCLVKNLTLHWSDGMKLAKSVTGVPPRRL